MKEWVVAVFTPVERAYLGALLGVDTLGGAPDPFAGHSVREIEMILFRTRLALTEHGVLQVGPDGGVMVEPWAADLVRVGAAQPSASLRSLAKTFPYIFRTARRAPRPDKGGAPKHRAG